MIKVKEKPCKGTGLAKGHGCGKLYKDSKKGLCYKCYAEWLNNTDEGRKIIQKHIRSISYKKKVERNKKTIELMSSNQYRSEYIQTLINEIARLIDHGQKCIASRRYKGKMNGGHCHSVGSNATLALNLHNIHIQSFESNSHKAGDHLKYRLGIIEEYGRDYADFIDETLSQCPVVKLTKDELIELRPLIKEIRNELKTNPTKRNPKERIKLRNEINQRIGIYKKDFAVFGIE